MGSARECRGDTHTTTRLTGQRPRPRAREIAPGALSNEGGGERAARRVESGAWQHASERQNALQCLETRGLRTRQLSPVRRRAHLGTQRGNAERVESRKPRKPRHVVREGAVGRGAKQPQQLRAAGETSK